MFSHFFYRNRTMEPKDRRHKGHVVVAPDAAMVINNLGRHSNNPKGNSQVFAVFAGISSARITYLPGVPLGSRSRRRRMALNNSLGG